MEVGAGAVWCRACGNAGTGVICPALPLDDPAAGMNRWANIVCQGLAATNAKDFVIVGYSVAGLVLPLIATRHPVARIVCAMVSVPGRRHVDCLGELRDTVTLPRNLVDFDERGRMVVPWETARDYYYQYCQEAVARGVGPFMSVCARYLGRGLADCRVAGIRRRVTSWAPSTACLATITPAASAMTGWASRRWNRRVATRRC